jgi:hypothetical protein
MKAAGSVTALPAAARGSHEPPAAAAAAAAPSAFPSGSKQPPPARGKQPAGSRTHKVRTTKRCRVDEAIAPGLLADLGSYLAGTTSFNFSHLRIAAAAASNVYEKRLHTPAVLVSNLQTACFQEIASCMPQQAPVLLCAVETNYTQMCEAIPGYNQPACNRLNATGKQG